MPSKVTPYLRLYIFGDKIVERKLMRGAVAIADPRPALNLIADDVMEIIRINFESGGRRGGGSWKALSPDTVKRRAEQGLDTRPLIASGALMDSMTVRDDPDQYLKITKSKINLSSFLPYAVAQDEGTEDGHIPPRPFVSFIASDKRRWAQIMTEEIRAAMHV